MLSRQRFHLRLALRRGDLVRGESYNAAGRNLTPIARVRAYKSSDGRFELRAVDPVGIVEEVGGTRRLIALGDGRGGPIVMLALMSLPVVAYIVAVALAHAARQSRSARKRR